MKTFIYILMVVVLTVSIPMVVAHGQKQEAAVPSATTIDTYQMMVDAKDLPVLEVDQPFSQHRAACRFGGSVGATTDLIRSIRNEIKSPGSAGKCTQPALAWLRPGLFVLVRPWFGCPLWVRSGHGSMNLGCPFLP
jgi:hypothetical protein